MSTKRYTPEFKDEAVRQVVERGYSVAEVSDRLGVSAHSLHKWVKMVIPVDDPSEPCYEAETVQLLREIKDRAEREDINWLANKGKVYEAVDAA